MKKLLCSSFLFLASLLLFFQLAPPVEKVYALTNNNALPPSNLSVQLTTPSDAKLSWSSVYGATGYNVYGITDGQLKLVGTTTSTSYSFNNIPEGDYSYVVSTLSTDGESGPCAPVTFNVTYPNMTAPTALTSKIQNGNDIVLTWTSSQYAKTYNIYQIASDGQKTLVNTSITPTYTITNAPAGSYTYAVSAVNPLYGESSPSASTNLDIVLPVMTTPGNFTYSILNGNDISLKWNAVSYATSYKVYQIVDGQKTLKSTTTATSISYTNMTGGDYVYEVHSYSDRFGESQDGSTVTFTLTLPVMQTPSGLTYSIANGNDITLKWAAVPYATNYTVYQIIDGVKVLKSTLTGTTVTYSNMPGNDYIYEVHSYSTRFGESQDGSQISFNLTLPSMEAPSSLTYSIANGNDITLKWASVPYATNYRVYQIVNGQKVLKSTLTGTSITYTNMAGGDYTYEVHSYSDRFGESTEGNTLSFTLALPIMAPPTDVVQTIKNATDFTLNWTASPYATSYKIYQIVNGQKVLKSTVTSTTVSYTNMASGDYSFEIHSYSTRFGESSDGSTIIVTLNGQTMQAPTNLTYSITNGNDITLKWTASPYATSYKIYQVIDGQAVLQKTVTTTSASFTNMAGGNYDYLINSVSTILGESPVGAETAFTLVLPTMTAPANLAYKIQNGNDVVLTWSAVTYANNYKVYELVDGQLILKTTVTSLTATLSNVPEGDHTYVVNSVSTRFGESQDGSNTSLSLTFPTMLAPGNFTYSIANGNDITLKWNSVTYATGYNIYQLINGQRVLKQTVTGTSVTFTNMPEGDYNFEIHSYSTRFGESQDSSQTNFTLVFPVMQAPSNFTYSIVNGNDITLKWGSTLYTTNYRIYQIINGQKTLKQTVTGTSVTFTNMPEGDYNFEIDSYSTRFGESQDGSQTSFTLVFPVMQAPANLTNTIVNGNDITLKWNASSYATAYRVYQIVNGQRVLKQTVTTTSATFTNMPEGDYSYEVNSYSSRFGESPVASPINLSLIWPVVQAPSLVGTISNINNITFSWQSVSWANEYRIYETTDGNKQLLYKGTALSYKVFNLSEGTHSYQITAYSTRFGESQLSTALTETIVYPDMQSPVATLKVLDQSSALISWNFVTYANGYNIYEIIDGNAVLVAKNINNLSYTLTNLPYANHLYYVTSYSNSFGESQPSNTVLAKLIVDTEPPITNIDALSNWTNQSDVLVNLSATDKDTGIAATYYSIDDGAFVSGTSFKISKEGITKISFYSVDKVGNIESIKTAYVKIDKTASVTTSNISDIWSNNDVTVNLNATDSQSGVARTFYSIDGSDYIEGTSFTIQTEGIHTVSFYSVDAAGNIESAKTAYVKIDKTASVTTSNISDIWSNNDVTVNLNATDSQSVVARTFYSIDGSDYIEGTSFTIQTEGIHTVSFYSVDAAGNIESAKTAYVKIDKTIPTLSMLLSGEYKLGTLLQLNYNVSDNLSGIASEKMLVFAPNQTTGVIMNNGSTLNLDKPGVYKVVITATDAAGNSYTIERQFVVYIPANIEVTSKVIKGNNGVFTVRVDLPTGYSTCGLDLNTAKANGVSALNSNNGYYNQAKIGQFKFERSDFSWSSSEVVIEFRCYINGYLVIGQTTVKVQK
ncbi:OmpL47-type beta-barrel domain-containing protein [Clostridium folliculivorans]|uniref:OmpL47-type beta-barrel domain-containing protein n=2 Tax=Clostridium folliculivorans TaxID=2886038 RepID=UPI0021C4347B|nr:hypothetical protein [Clostridium folliculivorans]